MIQLATNELKVGMGNKIICKNLTFTPKCGERWGILGPNGVGKTTLLHTLAGLYKPGAGNVMLDHTPITLLSAKEIACKVGILFQDESMHFPQTVWEYVSASRFPHLGYFEKPDVSDSNIIESALLAMDLHSFKKRLIQHLSGGEKRRLSIAALLAQAPNIYLLDEPLNHLDLRYQKRVMQYFKELSRQATIIMSLHDIHHAEAFCTHILLMYDDGRIYQGKTSDMLNRNSLSELYGISL